MEIKNDLIEFNKLEVGDYIKPFGFTMVLIMMAILMNSTNNGLFQNSLTIVTIILLIILIPLNQIFRLKRIHIYKIQFGDSLEIYYQDILREKEVKRPINEFEFENLKTNIRGCSKLKLTNESLELNQYCNKYWTNEMIEKLNSKLNELKSQEV